LINNVHIILYAIPKLPCISLSRPWPETHETYRSRSITTDDAAEEEELAEPAMTPKLENCDDRVTEGGKRGATSPSRSRSCPEGCVGGGRYCRVNGWNDDDDDVGDWTRWKPASLGDVTVGVVACAPDGGVVTGLPADCDNGGVSVGAGDGSVCVRRPVGRVSTLASLL